MHTLTISSNGLGKRPVSQISVAQNGARNNDGITIKALPIDNGDWRHISAEKEWLEALTPTVLLWTQIAKTASNESAVTTALANIYAAGSVNLSSGNLKDALVPQIESITSTAMADAVSRVGMGQQYDTLTYYTSFGTKCSHIKYAGARQFCPGPPPSDQFSLLAFNGFPTGYAYQASRATDYLSLGVLLLHLIVALGHTLYLLLTRYSSASWEMVEELIVLAQVSRTDTKDLRNTKRGHQKVSHNGVEYPREDVCVCSRWRRGGGGVADWWRGLGRKWEGWKRGRSMGM